jgi:predicted NBD/HSP70 family sugar kinase
MLDQMLMTRPGQNVFQCSGWQLKAQRFIHQSAIHNLVYIDIGEDIRAGILSEGKIHRGFGDCAGQIGHICVDKSGPLCSCGNTGCLNTLASETAMVSHALGVIHAGKSPALAQKFKANNGTLCLDDIFKASLEGDQIALEILQIGGNLIGEVLAGLITFSIPTT